MKELMIHVERIVRPINAASGQLLVPAFFGVGGVAAMLGQRSLKPWLELEITK